MEDRGSCIQIDTSWQSLSLNVATGRDPRPALLAKISEQPQFSTNCPVFPLPLSVHLCSKFFLLDGLTGEQREKRSSHQRSLPPLLLTSSTQPLPTEAPLSQSLFCHRGAAVSRPMDRFMVRPGTPRPPNKHPPGTPSHQTPQFNAAVKDFCSPSMLITLYTGAHCTSTAKAQKVSHF